MAPGKMALDGIVAELVQLCAGLPGSEQYVMVHHPAFRVGKKPFAIAGMQKDGSDATLAINLGRDEQFMLLDDPRFERTRYIGQHGWVTVSRAALSAGEMKTLVVDSWRRVAGKRNVAALEAGATSGERARSKPPARRRPGGKRAPAKKKRARAKG